MTQDSEPKNPIDSKRKNEADASLASTETAASAAGESLEVVGDAAAPPAPAKTQVKNEGTGKSAFLVGAGIQHYGSLGIPVALTSLAFVVGLLLIPFGAETRGRPLPM